MKKHLIHSISVLFALIIILSINSCKKEDSDLKQNTTDLITNAKQAFINQIAINQNYQLLSSNSKKSFRHGLAKSPDWKNAAVKTLRNGKAVLVPIAYEKDIFLKVGDTKNSYQSLKTLSYLLIYDNKEKAKTIEWITLMPDNVSDSNKGNKFSGKVIIEDWAGNFKKGYVFNKDGKIFNLNIQNENIEGPKVQSNNVKVNDVYCISTPWYGQNISGGESFWYIGGYDTSCYSTGSPYEDNYTNTGNELGGNHGETFPSDYVPVNEDYSIIKTDCISFSFSKTSTANWQEAGLNNIRLKWVWLGGNYSGITREIYIDNVVFDLPTQYQNANGTITFLTSGEAATKAAIATEAAKNQTYQEFRDHPLLPDDAAVELYFRNKLQLIMATQRGTAGYTGSGSPNIRFKNEERSNYSDPYDCF